MLIYYILEDMVYLYITFIVKCENNNNKLLVLYFSKIMLKSSFINILYINIYVSDLVI